MIVTFADADTEAVFHGHRTRRIHHAIVARARIKLDTINAACSIQDLRAPPGNRLEALVGDRAGQFSIRINERWRICFRFETGNAFDVEIVDYH